ncbi:MAG: ATP-dependent DNA helicase RecG, partial [Glaciecola sp.]
MISPEASVADVPGVGLQTAKALGKAFGIVTVRDLVEHYPRRHQDLGARMDLSEIIQGEPATLVGHIRAWNTKVVGKKRLKISEAIVDEVGGGTFMISYFNQPWKATKLRPGTRIAASGTVKYFGGTPKIDGPELEVMGPRDEMGQGDRLQP